MASKVVHRAGQVGVACLAAFVIAVLGILVVLPRLTHGVALTVLTGSMRPSLPVGSVVIEHRADPARLRVGQVATYQPDPGRAQYVTHRIVAIDRTATPALVTFKGDANQAPDPVAVPATEVRGVVWFDVPYLGRVRQALATSGPRSIVVGLGVLGLSAYSVYQLLGGVREYRQARPSRHRAVRGSAS